METLKVEAVVLKTDDFGGNVTLHPVGMLCNCSITVTLRIGDR